MGSPRTMNHLNQIVMDRFDRDFYAVEIVNGKKQIHLFGYFYDADDGEEDHYRRVEFTFCYLNPGFTDRDYDLATTECTQYIEDLTEEQCAEEIDNYFGDEPVKELNLRSVTKRTPCGYYIDTF